MIEYYEYCFTIIMMILILLPMMYLLVHDSHKSEQRWFAEYIKTSEFALNAIKDNGFLQGKLESNEKQILRLEAQLKNEKDQ